MKPMSDDTAARLMAVLYVFGGGQEQFLFQYKAREDILYAQRRCKLMGGEVPDADMCMRIKAYIAELDGHKASETWAQKWVKGKCNIELYD